MKIELIGEVFDRLDVAEQIQNATEDVELIVNTEGGSVFEGLQIVNAIQNCKYKVTAEVQVMACSIGAVVCLSADRCRISKTDALMVHNCWTVAVGGKKDLQAEINAMEVIDTILQNIIAEHCFDDSIRARMDEGDVWLTGEQVVELFEHAELIERQRPVGLVASGTVVDLLNKFNILREKVSEYENSAKEKEKEEETTEKPAETEKNEEKPSEIEENGENSDKKDEYVVTDELKALLARASKLE